MNWETPSFVEVKMDAEINSYQDDFRDTPDVKERPTEVAVTVTTQE
jgi:coenzyme PQQ precursor peptide PqqA